MDSVMSAPVAQIGANGSHLTTTTASKSSAVRDANVLLTVIYDIYNYSSFYLVAAFGPIGVVMNLMIIIVFCKWSVGTTKTTRVYYIVIACGELVTLIVKDGLFFLLGNGIFVVGVRDVYPEMQRLWENELVCNLLYMFWFISESMTNNTFIALSLERVIVLYKPFRAAQLTRRRAMTGIGLLLAFNVGLFALMPVFHILRVQPNSYMVDGIGCYGGGPKNFYSFYISPVMLSVSYIVPPYACIVMNLLIIHKIRTSLSRKPSAMMLAVNNVQRSEIEPCVTLVIISTLHVLFYVPLATFRIVPIVLPRLASLTEEDLLLLNGVGFMLYVLVIPVRLSNFIVYWRRVRGFSDNCFRVCLCGAYVPFRIERAVTNTAEAAEAREITAMTARLKQ